MQWKKLIKGLVFIIIFAVLFSCVSQVLTSSGDNRNYQWIMGFYKEPEDSLDAVYVGSSAVYAFWNPLVAWEKYGIAMYPYTAQAQHFITTEYLIREVHKTQPNALIIVNTNTIDDGMMEVERFHHLLDYMPFSLNKMRLTWYMSRAAGLTWEETLELFVPLYRYHDRWSDVHTEDLTRKLDGLKGTSNYKTYFTKSMDLRDLYLYGEEREPLTTYVRDAAISLMDYCEKENVRILFVTVPRAETETRLRQLNELNAMLEERGFDTLNLGKDPELCKLDLEQDYYNERHTNVHGSLKFTQYLSEYLIEHYGLTDKRGNEIYTSWDKGYDAYQDTLHENILDIELDLHHRTTAVEKPENLTVSQADGVCDLTWEASEGADGYEIYRREKGETWQRLDETSDLHFADTTVETEEKYDYTIVPFMTEDGQTYYGKFDYKGVKADTQ